MPMVIWCGAIALSRVLMRRHYLLDVLGGLLIGLVEAWVFISMFWVSEETSDSVIQYFLEERSVGASYDV